MITGTGRIFALMACVLGALLSGTAQGQCAGGAGNPSIPLSTPVEDFEEGDDGTVDHLPSRLVWQRCVLGETWNGSACEGTPDLLSWSGALQAADGHVQDGADDWRLPSRNELYAIVEDRCQLPAINGTVFPGAPVGGHWSSSPYAGGTDEAWIVDFDSGRVVPAPEQTLLPVRLVRGGRFLTP